MRTVTLRMAGPSLAAMLAQSAGNLLDALLIARQPPSISAAISLCYPLITAQQAIGFTLGMGAGSHMSRKIGEGETQSALRVASTAMLAALFLGLLLCVAGFFQCAALLSLLGAQESTAPAAAIYARFLLACSPVTCLSLVCSSLLRAQGKARFNMIAACAAFALGMVLSPLLILLLRLGVWGAGASLLAREALQLLILLLALRFSPGTLRPQLRLITLRRWVIPALLRSGLPTLLRQGAASLSAMMLSRAAAALGPAALAGVGLCTRAAALVSAGVIGFGQGFAPVCGAAFGAKDDRRIAEAYAFCMRALILVLLIVGAVCFFAGDALLRLFAAPEDVHAAASAALRAQSPLFFAQGGVILMNMLTQAMGMTARASWVALSRQGLFLIPLLLILPRRFGFIGLILCPGIADLLALLFSWLLTRRCIDSGRFSP